MLPEICSDVGFNMNEILFSDSIIQFLIETYTNEAGVRKIKEKMIEIIRDINLNRFHKPNQYMVPFTITKEYVMELFENKPKVRTKLIHTEPGIGIVNGLYATASGIGGITPIQVMKFPATKMLELNITGKAGDVMKESVEYSLKNAFSLLSKEKQDSIIEDSNNKKIFGLHIHFPDGATPKDGPSAGLAITLAFYSILMDIAVRNDICMTGEIDLRGNAGIIGGLESKLNGAKKAGCKMALVPIDNMDDMERMRREGSSPEGDDFKVIAVKNIKEVLEYSLVKNI
jgi:ATP-dependent Lon protease